jgi:hypothetical protein
MYFLINLAFPLLMALIISVTNGHFGWNLVSLNELLGNIDRYYILFSIPHLAWALVTSYFDISDGATIGGFLGAHIILIGIAFWVGLSNSPDATNGWFLYFIGSPITICVGALFGKKSFQNF